MKKKLLFAFTIILIVLCGLSLFGCKSGEVPVDSIVITKLPKLDYYRGDFFELNSSEVTIYYENGTTKIVPLTLEMLSEYDAQNIGDQTITIKYEGSTAYIKVSVAEAPIYSIEIVNGNYKTEYVQDQIVDLKNLNIKVTYSNNFTEIIPVTDGMLSGFETETIGEKQLIVSYRDKTDKFNINVVKKSIIGMDIERPTKRNYVVGDTIDLTGGKIKLFYNNNSQDEAKNMVEFLDDPRFSVQIDDEATTTFTKSSLVKYVTINYAGFSRLFEVRIEELKAKSIELVTNPLSPVIDSANVVISGGIIKITYSDGSEINVPANTANLNDYWRIFNVIDMSRGSVRILFNNNSTEIINLDDERVEILWQEFDISRLGIYTIGLLFQEVRLDYEFEVIDAKEVEIIIMRPETPVYQDSGVIDIAAWEYKIKLANGTYRAFDSLGTIVANVNENMIKQGTNPNFSTETAGERSFTFVYASLDTSVNLEKTITFDVIAKEITSVVEFVAPTIKVYSQGATIDTSGGKFILAYNDGSDTEWINITKDMQVELDTALTSAIENNVVVELLYTDTRYNTFITMSYEISIVRAASAIQYNVNSSVKLNYILGETFDSNNLMVNINFADGGTKTEDDFSTSEWTFTNTIFDTIGSRNVRLYYGDISSGIFVSIPVVITNDIIGIEKVTNFVDFGTVIEGMDINIPENAYIIVTRQDNSTEQIKVLASMLNYNRAISTLGARQVVISYDTFTVTASVDVLAREMTEFRVTNEPTKLSYVYTDTIIELNGMLMNFKFNNGTTAVINGETVTIASQDESEIIYNLAVGANNYHLAVSKLDTELNDNQYIQQNIYLSVFADDILLFRDSFEVVCFLKLIEKISFVIPEQSEQSFILKEGYDFEFPSNATIKVVYADNTSDVFNLSTLDTETYEVVGYNKNKAGSQTVTLKYFFNECNFTVKVRAKLLESIIVNPSSITVIEGMAISSDDISIKLHYVDADGNEFAPIKYIDIELNSVISSYNKNTVVTFNMQDTNSQWYYEANYNMSYTYSYYDFVDKIDKTITVSMPVLIRINRKSITGISMNSYPKQVYIEDISGQPASELDLSGGSVLITYNNGTYSEIALSNANLIISDIEFDTSEIDNGSEKNQKITVTYTDNTVTMTTFYNITVKDRKYLTIHFEENTGSNTYLFEYGTGESARPNFYVSGYLTFNGSSEILADNSDIDEIDGFSVYYLDSNNQASNIWPKNVGVYTLVVEYEGDGINNYFINKTKKIEIFPKSIVVRAIEQTLTFGQFYVNEHDVFDWYVQGYHKNGNEITYTDNPLVFDELQEIVASISFRITTKSAQTVNFYNANGTTIVNANVGTYNLNPFLVTKLSQNYKIEEYKSCDLIVQQKNIKIEAQDVTKVYGQSDPLFLFKVLDADNIEIGGNMSGAAQIWLGGVHTGYSDPIPTYTLGRLTSDTNNVIDTHRILAGAANQISNYNIINYTEAVLTITPKPITICGDALQKAYASATPSVVFRLKSGSSMGYGELFTTIFAQHINKSGTKYDLSIYESDNLSFNLAINNDLTNYASVGSYKIKLNIIPTDIPNYAITVEMVDLVIVPTLVNIALNCITTDYDAKVLDIVADADELGWYEYQVNTDERSVAFESGYLLDDSQLNLKFIKEQGKNVGKYQIKLSTTCHNENSNFVLNLIGDYGEYYAYFVSTYYPDGVPQGTPSSAESDANNSYLLITPTSMLADIDISGEEYSRKSVLWLDTTYIAHSIALANGSVISGLDAALSFNFVNKDITKANLGYFTADDYFGKYTYNYFKNENSRNYLCSGTQPEALQKEILSYILNGTVGSFVITYDFEYTIYPYELDTELLNNNVSYNGTAIPLTYSAYDLAHASDSLSIISNIKVVYNDTVTQVVASKVQEAGVYTITLTGVSNYNYCLSQDTLDRVKNITVSPILLKIAIDETKLLRPYSGKPIQPMDNNWVDTKGADDEIGYFHTTTYRIVNDVLSAAPKTISIYPIDLLGETPRNAGTYELFVRINSTYKNLTTLFVKRNPAWNSGDSIATKYIDTDYQFVISKKEITVHNWNLYNKKTYDGAEPLLTGLNQLILVNMAPNDTLTTSDLCFTFTRDMTKVPPTLMQIVDENDMVSAGYFNVELSIKETNPNWQNYYFKIAEEDNYYLINRFVVPVTLNTNNTSLTKQYDKKAPTGVFDEIGVGQSVIYDEIYFDLVIVSYYKNSVWTNWSGNTVFDVGLYAYNLRTKHKTGTDTYIYFEDENQMPIYDENTTNKLLSWNYSYYIIELYGLDRDNCDGVYSITQKDVAISLDSAKDEIYDFGMGNQSEAYVYSHIYNNQTISLASALSEINAIFKIVDKNGVDLDLVYYNNFVRQNLTGTGSVVKNAGDHFTLSFASLANANPNYKITNKPMLYAVKKLAVNLKLTFENTDNNSLPSMTFGDKAFQNGKINFVFDFINIAAFNAATGYSYTSIYDFISSNGGDYNNDKLLINSTYYQLGTYYKSTLGQSYSGNPYTRLNAGSYTPSATGLSAMNYEITINGVNFTVLPKKIVVNGLTRDYFNENLSVDHTIAGGSIDSVAESTMFAAWHFIDNTDVNDDASSFANDLDYYVYILKTDMVTNNPNYTLSITQCEGLTGTNSAYYYVPLTVKRVNLVVGFKNTVGGAISVQYGHKLAGAEYKVTYGNLPNIDFSSSLYNPAVEASKQNDALAIIENQFLNIEAIIALIKGTPVGGHTFSLTNYIRDGANIDSLSNFSITLSTEVSFIINKIELALQMVNNAGNSYNQDGYFSAIIDEVYTLTYSTSSTQRLTYSFTIVNANAIIRPDGVVLTTLVDQMTYILGLTINAGGFVVYNYTPTTYTNYNDFVINYINTNINYQINAQNGSSEFTAGLCKIKLTDNWYNSLNYTLTCTAANIMIYPKIKYLGDSNNEIPFSAVSLKGSPADYDTEVQNLSMYLQIYYNGFLAGNDIEWVDIERNVILPSYYAGANYNRAWTINIADGQVIAIGNDIRLSVTMSESFFNDMGVGTTAVVNTITSREFVVRLYSPEQVSAITSQSSQIVKNTDSSVYNYKEIITGNYTYYFSESSMSTASFYEKFDILSIKLKLSPIANFDNYYVDILLFDNVSNRLTLRISGGMSANYQLIMTDIVGNNIYYSEMLPGLDAVDLFDGMSHTLKIYIDKLGFKANFVEESTDDTSTVTTDRYYKVMWVIDDAYSCSLDYNGGQTIEYISINPVSGLLEVEYTYTKFIDFNNNGKFGFILSNANITVNNFNADKMGVKLTNDGYASDFMLWPSAFSNNYSYYITDNGEIDTETILETISFNSGYGYNNINVVTVVRSDETGLIVTGLLEKGTYLVTVTAFYRISSLDDRLMETKTVRLIVSDSNYLRVGIKDNPVPNYSLPTIYESGAAYFTNILGSYSYTKMVFDYANVDPNTSSVATILLKTNENRTSNIMNYDINYPDYKGVALRITYDGGTHLYTTQLQIRIGSSYWNYTFDDIVWDGSRNILETRYCKSSGIMLITLYRGGSLLLSYNLKNGTLEGLSGADIIGIAGMSAYIALSLTNVDIKMYAMELNSKIDTNLDTKDSIITADKVLTDGDGAPISTHNFSTFFSFKATGSEFKFYFANTVGTLPNIFGSIMDPDGSGARGAYLSFYSDGVQFGIYKYNINFDPQAVGTVGLLDGLTHNVSIIITKEILLPDSMQNKTPAGYKKIDCYGVDVIIDGTSYIVACPVWNNLEKVGANGQTGAQDAEKEDTIYFLSDFRFLSIVTSTATVQVNDMILY